MTTLLSIENLTKQYGDFTAVNGVNLEASEGKVFGLLGPNGAGKSTTISFQSGAASVIPQLALLLIATAVIATFAAKRFQYQ